MKGRTFVRIGRRAVDMRVDGLMDRWIEGERNKKNVK
jgi:hypothetical protein